MAPSQKMEDGFLEHIGNLIQIHMSYLKKLKRKRDKAAVILIGHHSIAQKFSGNF